MSLRTDLTRRLGIDLPVFQAPIGGGLSTTELVVAVSEAGGLGFVAAAYLTPERIESAGREVRDRTRRPFGINVFAPLAENGPQDASRALSHLRGAHTELGLPDPEPPKVVPDPFETSWPAVLESGASVVSFTFGHLPPSAIDAAKGKGMFVIGTATTVEEAVQLERAGVDAIVLQGSEAGAHRGTFATSFEEGQIGTMALVPQAKDAVGVPVVASGASWTVRSLVAALALGAEAVQMGTAFLTVDEAGTPEAYRQAILSAREDSTRVTRAFSGRHARGIVNRFMDEVDADPEAILSYPVQNALTRPMRTAAAQQGRSEFLSLWAGQGLRLARRESTTDLMRRIEREAEEVLKRLA